MKKLNIKALLLFDIIGAVVSTVMLGVVLVAYQEYVGLPSAVLKTLAGFAAVLSLYGLFGYVGSKIFKGNRRQHLKSIAIVNILYCIYTIVLLGIHFEKLTYFGWAYFIIEITVIAVLTFFEWKVIHQKF